MSEQNIHISPETDKPFPSWVRKEVTYNDEVIGWYWDSPVVMPTTPDTTFVWNEDSLEWQEHTDLK
jgi:hypothetical protein